MASIFPIGSSFLGKILVDGSDCARQLEINNAISSHPGGAFECKTNDAALYARIGFSVVNPLDSGKKGTRQIRVILYAKGDLHGARAPADELPIEDIPTVEHNVIPLDGADVFQQGGIDSIGDRIALAEDPGDLPRLPVDDARQDQVQAAAGVHLLPQLAGVSPAPAPLKDVPGQGEVAESGAGGAGAAARSAARCLQRRCLGHVSTPRYRKMAP